MKDLIEALKIISKYLKNPNAYAPIQCAHDVMYVNGVNFVGMDYKTIKKIYKLGFIPGSDENYDMVCDILGEDFDGDWDNLTEEDWDKIKFEIDECMYSYRFGSC